MNTRWLIRNWFRVGHGISWKLSFETLASLLYFIPAFQRNPIYRIVEAKHRSGSTVTAKYAKEQEKKVFCIPGNIDAKTSVGTNRLIQAGAKLVTSAEDILVEYGFPAETNETEQEISVEEEYLDIYKILTHMPTNINIIAKKCNLDIAKVSQKLLMMEIKGYIKSMPGNGYVRL